MYVIISGGTPLYCDFNSKNDVILIDDIRNASKFNDDDVAVYYLGVARKYYPTIGLHLLEVPNEIFGDSPKKIISELTDDERYEVLSGYHE